MSTNSEPIKEEPSSIAFEPYHAVVSVRPLYFLLNPLGRGDILALNGKVHAAINRRLGVAVEANYFAADIESQPSIDVDLFSIRVDLNRYFFNQENRDKYAEGFHVGPYAKFGTRALAGTDIDTDRQSFVYMGCLIGFQRVQSKSLINPHFGLGLGFINSEQLGLGIGLDARLGLSIGLVLF